MAGAAGAADADADVVESVDDDVDDAAAGDVAVVDGVAAVAVVVVAAVVPVVSGTAPASAPAGAWPLFPGRQTNSGTGYGPAAAESPCLRRRAVAAANAAIGR